MATIINADTNDGLKLTSDTSGEIQFQSGGTTKMTVSSSGVSGIPTYAGMKNLIINGNMQIAQRATSVAGITAPGTTYNTLDRWSLPNVSLSGTWTQSQDTNAPTGQGFANSLKMECTSSASLSANTVLELHYIFEGQNLQQLKKGTANAESITLSFWVKTNKTGTYAISLIDNDNTRHIGANYTVSSADTWEKIIITFVGDTTGILDNDNNPSLRIIWHLAVGSDYTSGTADTTWASSVSANRAVGQTVNLADTIGNYINMTGVQLEVGDTATDFEHLQYGQQLALCQRYYETLGYGAWGQAESSSNYAIDLVYKVTKRTTPSIGLNVTSNIRLRQFGVADRDATSPGVTSISGGANGGLIKVNGFSGLTIGIMSGVGYTTTSETGDMFYVSAEL